MWLPHSSCRNDSSNADVTGVFVCRLGTWSRSWCGPCLPSRLCHLARPSQTRRPIPASLRTAAPGATRQEGPFLKSGQRSSPRSRADVACALMIKAGPPTSGVLSTQIFADKSSNCPMSLERTPNICCSHIFAMQSCGHSFMPCLACVQSRSDADMLLAMVSSWALPVAGRLCWSQIPLLAVWLCNSTVPF